MPDGLITPSRIVLVGFMGAGKSTVGPLVADALGWSFLDLDVELTRRLGSSIADVFRTRGEHVFREEERRLAEETASLPRHVLAAGGGAFAQPATRDALRRDALTVWLRCGLAAVLARIPPDGSRPLAGDRETIAALFAQRESSYREAGCTVDAEQTPTAVARDVVEAYRVRSAERRQGAS
ncbi:MAG TPA: shikimate kinase [Vicinamibacteria bacterium]|nr:shikimate kinase [Vicinamibacteria bacterium]